MSKLTLFIPILILIFGTAYASEINRPEDLEGKLTLSSSDYNVADPDTWALVTGDDLEAFLSHRWFGGLYFEKDPKLEQKHSILLLGRNGKRFMSQGLGETRPDRGELSIKEDRYCVWWERFRELCYKVMVGELAGKPVHLITRENGKAWAGIELLVK